MRASRPKPVPPRGRVTLADIAERCGVSRATVSRVLGDKLNEFPVTQTMVDRVRTAAADLGYRPNRLARAVRSQRTNLIGLSLITRKYPHWQFATDSDVMGRLTNAVLSHPRFEEYDLVIHARDESVGRPFRAMDFKTDLLDGMLYLMPSDDHLEFLEMASADFPIVLLGSGPPAEQRMPCVDMDNRAASRQAVEHLISTGRHRIMVLYPEEMAHLFCMKERLLGYREALMQAGLGEGAWIESAVPSARGALDHLLPRCGGEAGVDALFCLRDELAIQAMKSLQAHGLSVPGDVAVMGFDDSPMSVHVTPGLSSISQPIEEIAATATDLLIRILDGEEQYRPGFHPVAADLIVRGSTVGERLA